MGEVGGSRFYQGAGLGSIGKWTCPTCGTDHVTPLESGCPVCLAEDARREKAVAGAVPQGTLPAVLLAVEVSEQTASAMIRGEVFTEQARQTLAAALAHFVEHGAPDTSMLSKPVMIGWARELAGLEE